MTSTETSIHVMVAIIRDHCGRVLVCDRPAGKAHAGRWEFPGGKLEPGEAPEAGLRRELHEELGIVAGPMRKLIQIEHAYPDVTVMLDTREIRFFGGAVIPREKQSMRWVAPESLPAMDILEADAPIISALRLPEACLVTPEPGKSQTKFLHRLDAAICDGVRLVLLRAKSLPEEKYVALARTVSSLCRASGTKLILDASSELLREVDADGVHLDSWRLRTTHARPIPRNKWLSSVCHSEHELDMAARAEVDFALVSPVSRTASHPDAFPLGWHGFEQLARRAPFPVYALGGMTPGDTERARDRGGQGIAAIRGLWPTGI